MARLQGHGTRWPATVRRGGRLTVSPPCLYKGVAVDLAAFTPCPLPVPITTRHHFPNVADLSGGPAALVSTRREGSPLVAAPGHTVQVALTPTAAAALLRTLDGRTLPAEVDALVAGLRGAALDALERA